MIRSLWKKPKKFRTPPPWCLTPHSWCFKIITKKYLVLFSKKYNIFYKNIATIIFGHVLINSSTNLKLVLYLRFIHNLKMLKFLLSNGPNCDTRYMVSNARNVALTPEMWCRPDCLSKGSKDSLSTFLLYIVSFISLV